jgi:hypothetical protein
LIVKQICDQVEDFRKNAPIVIMEKAQITSGREPDNDPGEEAKDVADKWADNPGDLRIPIQLNVVVDNTHLHDQFEWDVSSWRSAPEAFADVLTREQGLSPEFRCVCVSHLAAGGKEPKCVHVLLPIELPSRTKFGSKCSTFRNL